MYFLGFIFTLISMASGLASLNEDTLQISSIIGSFAIALFTTIYGLIFRVLLTTFEYKKPQNSKDLTEKIENTLESFTQKFEDTSAKLNQLQNEIVNLTDTIVHEREGIQNLVMSEFEPEISSLKTKLTDALKDFSEDSNDSFDQIRSIYQTFSEAQKTTFEKTSFHLQDIATSGLTDFKDNLSKLTDPIKEELKQLGASMHNANSNILQSTEETKNETKQLHKSTSMLNDQVGSVSSHLGMVKGDIERFNIAMSKVIENTHKFDINLDDIRNKMSKSYDFLNIAEKIESSLFSVLENTQNVPKNVLAATKAVEKITSEVEKYSSLVESARKDHASAIYEAQGHLNAIMVDLASAAKELANRIKDQA